MPMRETPKTLRLYFILVGVIGTLISLTGLSQAAGNLGVLLLNVIGLVISLVFLYVGAALRKLLAESPGTITWVLYANMGLMVLVFLLGLLSGLQPQTVFTVIVGLLITWYLLKNVARDRARKVKSVPSKWLNGRGMLPWVT